MPKGDKETQKKVKEAQAIILEAFEINGVDMADGMTAIFTTGLAIMKEQGISNEDFVQFANGLIEGYKQLKKK